MKGIAALPMIIVIVVILAGFFVVSGLISRPPPGFKDEQQTEPPARQKNNEQDDSSPDLGAGVNKPFYSKDRLYLTHSWPSEGNFLAEETEILLFNESDSSIEVKSFNLEYQVEGKTYPHKSDTWEKFPNRVSWERAEYLNISSQYYKGEQLSLKGGEKGKLHWHINFGPNPIDGKQVVTVKLTLLKDGQTISIDKQFTRDSGEVFSKGEH